MKRSTLSSMQNITRVMHVTRMLLDKSHHCQKQLKETWTKPKKGEVKTQEMFHPGLPTSQNISICHREDVKQMFDSPVKFKNKLFLHLDHLCCSEFWAPFYRTSVLVPGWAHRVEYNTWKFSLCSTPPIHLETGICQITHLDHRNLAFTAT